MRGAGLSWGLHQGDELHRLDTSKPQLSEVFIHYYIVTVSLWYKYKDFKEIFFLISYIHKAGEKTYL